jgi:hypothetical protein
MRGDLVDTDRSHTRVSDDGPRVLKHPYSEFLPRKGSVIQVDDRARVLGRRAPTALGVFLANARRLLLIVALTAPTLMVARRPEQV